MVLKSDGYSSDHIRLNRFVFWSSAVSIGIFGLLFVLFPEKSQFWLTYVQEQVKPLFRVVLHVGDCAVFRLCGLACLLKSGTDSFRKRPRQT